MTADTKRALEIIKPIADELRIKIDADDKFLYINSFGIGIACNSTYATIMEFIGFLFQEQYVRRFREVVLDDVQKELIMRYWFTPEQIKKVRDKN